MIVKDKRHEQYFTFRTELTEDHRLSWKATGILVYIDARLGDFEGEWSDLVDRLTVRGDDRAAIEAALDELLRYGYLEEVA
jgi:hypothetical protein